MTPIGVDHLHIPDERATAHRQSRTLVQADDRRPTLGMTAQMRRPRILDQ